ncbi:large subunit ribosomal protein L24 [Halogranum gelatinilyticum]|uniref:Large ribosomal subunit protein uL24 n=1 Tax=Halogranum gelatinilyticum TaxID=660521 RepID=A0A1G9UHP3_9EURY|nr:50S ribosomal protein L24 [Halogranum gelatinilyticum]SDM59294.1 large subunit ribosomal protein L24 [Halogranum gelatinilyticum]
MSKQPRKQRTQKRDAPLHKRQNQVRATLSDDLREEYGQRNVRVNAGDTVEVLRGDHAGTEGEVLKVDLKDEVIHVEDVTVEKADGEETPRPLVASNVRVTELDLEDDRREARLEEGNE